MWDCERRGTEWNISPFALQKRKRPSRRKKNEVVSNFSFAGCWKRKGTKTKSVGANRSKGGPIQNRIMNPIQGATAEGGSYGGLKWGIIPAVGWW